MNKHIGRCRLVGLAAALGLTLIAIEAPAIIIVTPRPEYPQPVGMVRLTSQSITATLTDRAAEVNAEYVYHNPTDWTLEGTYLFPLPPEAAVDRFSLFVDGEEIHAELLDVQAARQEYESIVRRMRDPALLEYADRRLLKARIYPIQPRADAKIRLRYTHPLPADFGTADFVYPFAREDGWGSVQTNFKIDVRTESALKGITSPTHNIVVANHDDHHATVGVENIGKGAPGDFHLLCTYDTRDIGAQFLTMEDDSGQRYFMAIVAPGEAPDSDVLPKDVVFCFDHSGSMQGEKLDQARAALKFCLGRLNPDDRFGLLIFNDQLDAFAPGLRGATPVDVNAALKFVDKIDADGGTFIEGALDRALRMFTRADHPQYLVFLTDGLPTVGTRDPAQILATVRTANGRNVRVFTFGVGYDLNAALLNDLADQERGVASYVAPSENVEISVSNFFRKISRPLLTDCSLEFDGDATIHDVYPRQLADVYAGSEILVLGRFTGDGTVTARLVGTRGSEKLNHTFQPEFNPKPGRYAFIPKLWAGRRIGNLLEDMRRDGETPEVKDEVIRLSKKYGIMTPYTAFLAAPEEVRIAHSRMDPGSQPVPMYSRTQGRRMYGHSSAATDQATAKRDITAGIIAQAPSLQAFEADNASGSDSKPREDKSAAGRQFSPINGIWTDWDLIGMKNPAKDTICVQPYSDAYFRLTKSAEMAQILALSDRVIFLWHGVVIKVDTTGETRWNPAWDQLL